MVLGFRFLRHSSSSTGSANSSGAATAATPPSPSPAPSLSASQSQSQSASQGQPATGRRRRLLSRLRPSLIRTSGWWWHVSELAVLPDDPHRLYGPGESVAGTVVVKVTRPLRVTHVVVRLAGYANVFRRPNVPGKRRRRAGAAAGAGEARAECEPEYLGHGFVSLFEREQVVCGDGRLGEGEYRMRFEMSFPGGKMPTGIDFERGSISYHVSAVMTRPTSIGSTLTCERKIGYVERLDIASLGTPRPRILSLEPVRMRGRQKARHFEPSSSADTTLTGVDEQSVVGSGGGVGGADSSALSTGALSGSASVSVSASAAASASGGLKLQTSYSRSMQVCASVDGSNPDPNPHAEELDTIGSVSDGAGLDASTGGASIAGTSHRSAAAAAAAAAAAPESNRRPKKSWSRTADKGKRSIVSTIELARSGYLRGDSIPLKIEVLHTKQVTSTNGVIVTLYRQAQVDSAPALPLVGQPAGPATKGWRVGGGGGGGKKGFSSQTHVFRKDLAQSFASLIVNPATLTAHVRTAVRVPEDAFPTIDCVPGRMIRFCYFVEVVLDLNSKLTGLEHVSHRTATTGGGRGAGRTGTPATDENDSFGNQPGVYAPIVSSTSGPVSAMLPVPYVFAGPHFVDTAPVRRNKNVVVCTFEVVIGSMDSERLYRVAGPRPADGAGPAERGQDASAPVPPLPPLPASSPPPAPLPAGSAAVASAEANGRDDLVCTCGVNAPAYDAGGAGAASHRFGPDAASHRFGPDAAEGLGAGPGRPAQSEKERVRMAERLLLPYAPPLPPLPAPPPFERPAEVAEAATAGAGMVSGAVPSAPVVDEDEEAELAAVLGALPGYVGRA